MKIALDWIAEYLSHPPAAEAAADALMNAGLPVESIVDAAGAKSPTKILDVEVTSNRTDCLSHVGLARELAALTGENFTPPKVHTIDVAGSPPATELAQVSVENPAACPFYSARILRNIKVGPSPAWLINRLESIGLRPVNNVVDITNYVLMELGQPLHAFDLDALAEKKIIVRSARPGEKLLAIDGHEYTLDPAMLVIADAQKPVAIAGVMGGKNTEVTERTTAILLESARFDPLSIRSTSRALGLKSDSSYRFERGLDPTLADLASRRCAQLILEIAGATNNPPQLAPGVIALGAPPPKLLHVSMRFRRFEKITGLHVSPERSLAILTALGFSPWFDDQPGEENDRVCTCVPSHRLDVAREIDLIEEVARVLGYDHIPTLNHVTHGVTAEPPAEKAARTILHTLTEAGFSEAVTVTFISEPDARLFLPDPKTQLIHPQHAGWKSEVLRPSLFPSLLAVRRTNQNVGLNDARVFEKAEVFAQGQVAADAPIRRRVLAAVASDLSALTALLTLLPDRLAGQITAKMWLQPADFPFFVKGASGEVRLLATAPQSAKQLAPQPGIVIGRAGLFTPDLQRRYDLRNPVCGLELHWDSLLAIFTPVRRALPVPRFPGVKRDLSVVVAENVRWASIHETLLAAQLASLENVEFVTTFRGRDVGPDKKSLTLALDFRDPARTLTSAEVDAQVERALNLLANKFQAQLRGAK